MKEIPVFVFNEQKQLVDFYKIPAQSDIPVSTEEQECLIDCDNDAILIQRKKGQPLAIEPLLAPIQIAEILYPVLVIDEQDTVVMQAYTNREALQLSTQTKQAHYYSRSKQRLWLKGESSGHTQQIQAIEQVKDRDLFIYRIKQNIAACHTGYYSCFYRKIMEQDTLQIIYTNKEFDPDAIYNS